MTSKFKVQSSKFKFKFCHLSLVIGHSPQGGAGLSRRLAPPTPQLNVAGTFNVSQGRRPWEEVRGVQGQSLFEVLFAVAVATIILVGVVSLSTTSIRNTSYSNNNALATKYAQEAVEWLRGERDADWSAFYNESSPAGNTHCLGELSWTAACPIPNTIFSRDVFLDRITTADPDDAIEAIIEVIWQDAQGEHKVRTVSRFTDWRK